MNSVPELQYPRLGHWSETCRSWRHAIRPVVARPYNFLRSVRDCGLGLRQQWKDRTHTSEYLATFDEPNPLVSICIATYNRGRFLEERAVRSALAQTYENIEVIVVGDCCTDDTAERMGRIRDPRLRFFNLPERGKYPSDPVRRWMVAGSVPMNHAMRLARGAFITHLDDDDEHSQERVQVLLDFIRSTRVDLVWHPFHYQHPDFSWHVNHALVFGWTLITTSSVLYHSAWREIEWDLEAWRYNEPGDWNRFRRMRFLGLRSKRREGILLKHYRERSQTQK